MGRLIDADALKERAIRVVTTKFPHVYFKAVGTREIDKQPTVEAEPVVHGQWIPHENMIRSPLFEDYSCSECGKAGFHTNFCAYCGAKMDGKEEEE